MDNEIIMYQRATLALLAELVAGLEGAAKPEVLMGRAGLSHKEISALVGKSQPAVSKAISRDNQLRKEKHDD